MKTIGIPLVLCLLLAAEEKPVPKVPVGKETTVVDGPLDKEGYIDYVAALNERLGKGITPERNANVLIWKAIGPRPFGGEKGMPGEFFKFLGMLEPPEKGDYFINLDRYSRDVLKLDSEERDALFDEAPRFMRRTWAREDFRRIAEWLAANDKPLALIIEATNRPQYYNPLVPRRTETTAVILYYAILPSVESCRGLAMALTSRAMLRVQQGHYDEAWRDLLACHRLGRHVAHGGSFVETVYGVAISHMAISAELAYLEKANLTAPQIRDRLKDLEAIPLLPSIADKADITERIYYLDALQMLRRVGPNGLRKLPYAVDIGKPDPSMDGIDWDAAFRAGNHWFDRLAAALRVKVRSERIAARATFDKDFSALCENTADLDKMASMVQADKTLAKGVGKAFGEIIVPRIIPASPKNLFEIADRDEQQHRSLFIAFALAAYRHDNSRYPAKLDDLAPKYLTSVPSDLFSGKALIYRPSEIGYLFYSVGVNGKDEGGRGADGDPPGDDLSVRMPLPELKPKK